MEKPARLKWVALCAQLLLLAACGDENPTLEVQVVSGIDPGTQFTFVRTELFDGVHDDSSPASFRSDANLTARVGQDFAHGLSVARFSGTPVGRYTVQVQFLKADQRLVLRRRSVIDVQGDTVVRVHLTPNCIGTVCPSPGGGAGFSECLDGHCVDPRCNPPSPEFCDGFDFCAGEMDCGPYASCADATCIERIVVSNAFSKIVS
ncbi:MAG: hypothetical protein IPK60_16925 [Sandaracinaceae bacterium]|nr:hypothetical protein [Sandaracinaceae bacterium]